MDEIETTSFILKLSQLNKDERLVVSLIIERLLKGKFEYGNLNIAEDKRDFIKECLEETTDTAIYSTIQLLKNTRPDEIARKRSAD